jgi:hypothetical protein
VYEHLYKRLDVATSVAATATATANAAATTTTAAAAAATAAYCDMTPESQNSGATVDVHC